MGKEGVITVRLDQAEIKQIDAHTQGQLSRSQIVRILIQDFLGKPAKQQREFLVDRLFGQEGS